MCIYIPAPRNYRSAAGQCKTNHCDARMTVALVALACLTYIIRSVHALNEENRTLITEPKSNRII